MPTPIVNLGTVSVLSEIVLRGGDFAHPASRQSLKDQYARQTCITLTCVPGYPASSAPAPPLMSWPVREHILTSSSVLQSCSASSLSLHSWVLSQSCM